MSERFRSFELVTLTYIREEMQKLTDWNVTLDMARAMSKRNGFPAPFYGVEQRRVLGHRHKLWERKSVDAHLARRGYEPYHWRHERAGKRRVRKR